MTRRHRTATAWTLVNTVELIDHAERAVAGGTFEAPTFFVGGEICFGQDRLREVEEQIEARKTP